MSFDQLNLMPQLVRNVRACGYDEPTPIQREVIPVALAGRDVLGCAQTGTGKTAAFALPILQKHARRFRQPGEPTVIRTLILTPTRELALQIDENIEAYGKGLHIAHCVIFGGVSQLPQEEALHRGAEIVTACPGRLLDLMNQGLVRLEKVDTFVLDEADRMLDMGFIHDVKKVVAKLPEKRQTLFFSATMPAEVEKLATSLLHSPAKVKVDPVSSPVEAIEQHLFYIDKANKKHLLAKYLRQDDVESALVFSRTKHGADRIVRELKREGIEARAIHGDKSQGARQAALGDFKAGKCKVLIATDIAARGIDIEGLSHVFNYDLPNEPEAYIHRIGRTGRAGRTGVAVSFCCIDEMKQLNQIEKLLGRKLKAEESEWPMLVTEPSPPKQPFVRGQLPAKVNAAGQAAEPKKKPKPAPAPAPLRSGQRITIGQGGRITAGSQPRPVQRVNRKRNKT